MSKASFNKQKAPFISKLGLNLSHKLKHFYIWGITFCGVENWTFIKTDQKYLEIYEVLPGEGWRRSVGPIE